MRISGLALLALAGLIQVGSTQQIASIAAPFPSLDDVAAGSTPVQRDTIPCFSCRPYHRPVRAVGELFLVQLIPWTFNAVVRDKEWAHVNLQSWEENLENPWEWDNDHFFTNQFGHPYHGSLYFNTGRSNGYSFWGSVPWSYVGSATWELFG